jgi:hypothetical protein
MGERPTSSEQPEGYNVAKAPTGTQRLKPPQGNSERARQGAERLKPASRALAGFQTAKMKDHRGL